MVNGAERSTVNLQQAMKLAGVGRRTIYNWLKAGKIEYTRIGRSVRILNPDSLWRKGRHAKPCGDGQ